MRVGVRAPMQKVQHWDLLTERTLKFLLNDGAGRQLFGGETQKVTEGIENPIRESE